MVNYLLVTELSVTLGSVLAKEIGCGFYLLHLAALHSLIFALLGVVVSSPDSQGEGNVGKIKLG